MPSETPVVDIHAHLYPWGYLQALASETDAPVVAVPDGDSFDLMVRGARFVRVGPRFYDPQVRLAAMDAAGVDTQVLSLSPPMVYWAGPERAIELCRLVNDELAAIARAHPGRFIPGATLPLQTPDAAVDEIGRVIDLGHRMVAFPTHVHGMDLDDPSLEPVYRELEARDLPIFVHPIMPRVADSLKENRFDPLIGFPVETTYAAARIAAAGVLDRYPRLRFCWSHLGGALPFLADRISGLSAEGAGDFPGIGGSPARPHAAAFADFWFDTVVYSDRTLRYGAEFAGVERLVLGSDCPFFDDLSGLAVQLIRDADWLAESDRHAVLANAERFLRRV